MAALIRIAATVLLVPSSQLPAMGQPTRSSNDHGEAIARWRPLVAEASRRFGIPEAWVRAVMKAESGGQTHLGGRPIVSRAGAMGLMQLMPGTWSAMRLAHGLGSDPHDPRDNIIAGTAYLRAMYDRFGYPGLFAAYNAGPARYTEHLRSGRSLPVETRGYIEQVAQIPDRSMPPRPISSGTQLFFALGKGGKEADMNGKVDSHRAWILSLEPGSGGPE